jgi:hypothetical protein
VKMMKQRKELNVSLKAVGTQQNTGPQGVGPVGLEPTTHGLKVRCSNLLS